MKNEEITFDELDQCDYLCEEYIDKVEDKYGLLIGLFLIRFSLLEHELNVAIASSIHDDAHELGYVIIEKLTMSNKIELFYKMHVRLETEKDEKNKGRLDKIKKQSEELNNFRNCIVHANWMSLTREGFVRSRIIVDNQSGYVKFKKIKIVPKMIKKNIREIDKLISNIEKYTETAFQF